jgi:hypothetical protein
MGPEIFSRTIQSDVGIAFGLILFGVAMGALFAVIYAVTATRVGNISPRKLALLLAGGLFLRGAVREVSGQPTLGRALGNDRRVLPSLGHLSVNTAEYGAQNTETPQPLRDPAGTIVYRVFPPTTCTSSGSTRWLIS